MPSAPLVFRSSCGCFVAIFQSFMRKRATEKAALRFAMLSPRCRADGVTLGLLLNLMFWGGFLLQCGDVERNPGPKSDNLRQTRLTSGSGRRTSVDRTIGPGNGQTTPPPPPPQQPSLTDVMVMLQSMESSMNSKFEDMEKGIRELSAQYATLESGMRDLREEMGFLRKENQDLIKKNSELMAKIDELEKKTDDLEGRSKRNNLIFFGISRGQNETNEQCEDKLRDLFTDKLELTKDVEFDRVHRLNSKPDSPIIARCCFYKDKVLILKSKRKLQGSNVFIGEDFSNRVREIRRKLSPHLKKARSNGQKAIMVFNHLIIEGKKFFLDNHDNLKDSR